MLNAPKGEAIVIPPGLRKEVLRQIHQGHLGMERSKLRARELVYRPGMSKQIEYVVSSFAVCQELRHSNAREPMVPHEIPRYPCQIIGTDAFVWGGSHFVAVVDYYSRYWEVAILRNLSTSALIDRLKSIFARHGTPEIVKSDNGTHYSSAEFGKFAEDWKFSHVTSSPTYPKFNGLAEKTVQTIKTTLEKAKQDSKDPYLAILEQRNTSVDPPSCPWEGVCVPSFHQQSTTSYQKHLVTRRSRKDSVRSRQSRRLIMTNLL